MNRHSQRGVALIITLILLAVVTVMAVLFLGISRRDRNSVRVTEDQTDARYMADAGLARAEAEVVSRIMAAKNLLNYDLLVSTNYYTNGFRAAGGTNAWNVSYTYSDGRTLNANDQIQNIANLFYDPRPPVYVPTNGPRSNEFRFYLDLNRNRRFEPSGVYPTLDDRGRPGESKLFVGDPEWIGILQRPDQVHSPSNRFVGRYAFIALPMGKSLDINFIHNYAKFPTRRMTTNSDAFYRNQGVGSWEINLAGFLHALNTNFWDYNVYATNLSFSSQGNAFTDAANILYQRYNTDPAAYLASVNRQYLQRGSAAFTGDRVDGYLRGGPVLFYPPVGDPDFGFVNFPWPGSDNPRDFRDVQEFFDASKVSGNFTNDLRAPMERANTPSTYNRYTYYRLLSQLGTDSVPANRGKINLNYDNQNLSSTNFLPWVASNFFRITADRLIQAALSNSVVTNVVNNRQIVVTNKYLNGVRVADNIGVDYIPVFPVSQYYVEIHRMLQLAANIWDATTNNASLGSTNAFPTVFRPHFAYDTKNDLYYISGYTEETGTNFLNISQTPRVSLTDSTQVTLLKNNPNALVYGIPLIIGARKGFPNFNEFSLETYAVITRKLISRKPAPAFVPTALSQQYVLSISNKVGLELWNSYTQAVTRPMDVIVHYQSYTVMSNRTQQIGLKVPSLFQTNITKTINNWQGNAFEVPLNITVDVVPPSVRNTIPNEILDPIRPNNPGPDVNFNQPPPVWDLYVTNQLLYAMVDRSVNPARIVDYVSLDGVRSGFNTTDKLVDAKPPIGDTSSADDGLFWNPGLLGNGLTIGMSNQLYVSSNYVANVDWQGTGLNTVRDIVNQINNFRSFSRLLTVTGQDERNKNTNTVMQVPYTPSRKMVQVLKFQANDPLVHYHQVDLTDPTYTDPNTIQTVKPLAVTDDFSNLGKVNERYSPWGGRDLGFGSDDPREYDPARQDPMITKSDDWRFPTNKFPNIGWLGRVHRGTPWQTVYLKSGVMEKNAWKKWAGSNGTHPTNDWNLLDLFTTAPNDNAARGLLAVNQTNTAAWAAVLSGVTVVTNNGKDLDVARARSKKQSTVMFYDFIPAAPSSLQVATIVDGINRQKAKWKNKVFPTMGSILSTPELTLNSPFLSVTNQTQTQFGITDEEYERIPQQIMSLLKADEPRMVVYTYGQSLKPAGPPYSLPSIVPGGAHAGICTNYQITGEVVAKAVLRIDGTADKPKVVVESYNVLTSQ